MEVSGQLHAPVALPPGKDPPRYALDKRLDGSQSRPGRDGEEKKIPARNRTSVVQPVVMVYTNPYSKSLQ